MSFRVVIFDLGGVLVRLEPKRLLQELAQASGRPVEQLEQAAIVPKWIEQFELGRLSPPQFFEQLKQWLGLSWTFEQFVAAWNSILSENTDTTWVLPRLRERYTLVALTNTDALHDEHIRRTWPVFSQVHHWIASYRVGFRKPDPRIYRLALGQADAPPHTTVYVDDIEDHVAAARRLGLTAIHFRDGLKLERELRAVGLHV